MNHLTKIIYSLQLDDQTEVLKQIWINEKSDLDTIKMPTLGNYEESIINIIKKLHSEVSTYTIKIISTKSINNDNYMKEIGKDYL